jgi:hypothetical protein
VSPPYSSLRNSGQKNELFEDQFFSNAAAEKGQV